ncbi:MAG: hypothetical protein HC769_04210 [Cyanobacteria bacterium CRU_2_1]|nr:hypothetical protein [Cyanobacteria bacterium RU_5_0]NJR58121.1 hypothetical protein [Cyanobacteria bacterium CRU_2_1]
MTFASISLFDFDVSQVRHYKRFNIRGAEVFSDLIAGVFSATTKEKIGIVSNVLRDKTGRIENLVVDLGARKVLLSANRFWFNRHEGRVYAAGLTRTQVENLPEVRSN